MSLEEAGSKGSTDNDLRRAGEVAYTRLTQAGPDLARVVAAWDRLPEHIRRAVLALVESAAPKAGE